MSTYVQSGTTVANIVQTVTMDSWFQYVEVLNRSDGDLWVRVDGIDPSVNGDNSFIIPGHSWLSVKNRNPRPSLFNSFPDQTSVHLLSATPVSYTLCGDS